MLDLKLRIQTALVADVISYISVRIDSLGCIVIKTAEDGVTVRVAPYGIKTYLVTERTECSGVVHPMPTAQKLVTDKEVLEYVTELLDCDWKCL